MLCGALEFLPLDTAKVWYPSRAGVPLRFIVAHLGALVSTTPRVWSISVRITGGVCCRSRGVESRVEVGYLHHTYRWSAKVLPLHEPSTASRMVASVVSSAPPCWAYSTIKGGNSHRNWRSVSQ